MDHGENFNVLQTMLICERRFAGNKKSIYSREIMKIVKFYFEYWTEKTLKAHKCTTVALAISADGEKLISGGCDYIIKIWNIHSGECEQLLGGHIDRVCSVAVSSDNKLIASASIDGTGRIWQPYEIFPGWQNHNAVERTCDVQCLSASDNFDIIAFGYGDAIQIVSPKGRGWTVDQTLEGHKDGVVAIVLSQLKTMIVSGSNDKRIRIWKRPSTIVNNNWACKQVLKGHKEELNCIALCEKTNTIVSGAMDNTIRVWTGPDFIITQVLRVHTDAVWGVAISFDGATIASASKDGTVMLWHHDPENNWSRAKVLAQQKKSFDCIAMSRDASFIAAGSEDGTIRLWNLKTKFQ